MEGGSKSGREKRQREDLKKRGGGQKKNQEREKSENRSTNDDDDEGFCPLPRRRNDRLPFFSRSLVPPPPTHLSSSLFLCFFLSFLVFFFLSCALSRAGVFLGCRQWRQYRFRRENPFSFRREVLEPPLTREEKNVSPCSFPYLFSPLSHLLAFYLLPEKNETITKKKTE